jgi:hypothetical protein
MIFHEDVDIAAKFQPKPVISRGIRGIVADPQIRSSTFSKRNIPRWACGQIVTSFYGTP